MWGQWVKEGGQCVTLLTWALMMTCLPTWPWVALLSMGSRPGGVGLLLWEPTKCDLFSADSWVEVGLTICHLLRFVRRFSQVICACET